MSDVYLLGAIAALLAALTGLVVAWRKLKPETQQIVVTSAEKVNAMSLKFAGAASAENDALHDEINALRDEFRQYRTDTDATIAELKTELRAERLEKEAVKRENEELKARVTELEAEVAQLKRQ